MTRELPKWAFDPLWDSISKKRILIAGWNHMTWEELISESLGLFKFYDWTPLQIAQSFKQDAGGKYIPSEITTKHLNDIAAAIEIGLLTEDDTP